MNAYLVISIAFFSFAAYLVTVMAEMSGDENLIYWAAVFFLLAFLVTWILNRRK